MIKKSSYIKELLIEILKITIANISIKLNEIPNTDISDLKTFTIFHSAICLKSFYAYCLMNKSYTKKEFAKQEYLKIYSKVYKECENISPFELFKYLNLSKYESFELSEDEKFILLAIFNLPKFYHSSNINKVKHVLNTYISKINYCLRNFDEYLPYFKDLNYSTLYIKSILFKFLIENS